VAFLIAWAVGIALLTLSSVRLPSLYTLDIALVDLALIVLLFANNSGSAGLTKLGGYVVLTFAAIGAYIWLSVADQSLGGPGYPVGKPMRS
jgi:GPR1/FUN34/yaaH family.